MGKVTIGERIELARIKAKEKLELARIKGQTTSVRKRFTSLQSLKPAPMLSQEQNMMQEMFGGNDMWGTGRNLPRMNGALTSGHGLIKNDDFGETRRMFGGF